MSVKLPEQMEQEIAIIVKSFHAVIQEFLERNKVEHVCFDYHSSLNEPPQVLFVVKDSKYNTQPELQQKAEAQPTEDTPVAGPARNVYIMPGNDEIH